ncbi:MAG: hypothetical protein WBM53_00545, partial [Maribacter sp.]
MLKTIKKLLKKMLLGIGVILGVVLISGTLFINFSPEFGGKANKEQQEKYANSQNHKDGKFINKGDVQMSMDFTKFIKSLVGYFNSPSKTVPNTDIAVVKIDS